MSTSPAYDENSNLLTHIDVPHTTFVDSVNVMAQNLDTDDDNPPVVVQTTPELEYSDGHLEDLSIVFLGVCVHVIDRFDSAKVKPTCSYFHRYVNWMKQYVAQTGSDPNLRAKLLQAQTDQPLIAGLSKKVSKESAIGKGLVEIGKNLLNILHGELDPLELIFRSNIAEQYYREANARLEAPFRHVMELIACKQPGLKVLEIGAGTGSTTELVLKYASIQAEKEGSLSAISSYDFTDISQAFLSSAKRKFAYFGSKIAFPVLDISKDPMKQGFKEGDYDLIVAANVLHATPDLNVTLSNARRLLKPGGKIVIVEITENQWVPQVVFGTLPGWWLSNDEYRTLGPCISTTSWNQALSRNRFSGTDIVLHDSVDLRSRICSVLVASAVEDGLPGNTRFPSQMYL
ncbi:S-adenosyl-L-methionine-dependent methyltransferase [Xylariaceae sp. AK1471]|nr:S-adenosyl-L-methionine-dependent methyltransferase [Xylariaceae sp. AK1471]